MNSFTSPLTVLMSCSSSGEVRTRSSQLTIWDISEARRPRVVIAGTPTRMPEVMKGDLSSNGTMFLLRVISALTRAFSAFFPLMFLLRRSISSRWLSVPPETML